MHTYEERTSEDMLATEKPQQKPVVPTMPTPIVNFQLSESKVNFCSLSYHVFVVLLEPPELTNTKCTAACMVVRTVGIRRTAPHIHGAPLLHLPYRDPNFPFHPGNPECFSYRRPPDWCFCHANPSAPPTTPGTPSVVLF